MKKLAAQIAIAGVLAAGIALPAAGTADAATATATATATKYKNCTALVKKYPHGVRAKASTMNRSIYKGKVHYTKSLATVNAAVYNANKAKLDADKDGIACER